MGGGFYDRDDDDCAQPAAPVAAQVAYSAAADRVLAARAGAQAADALCDPQAVVVDCDAQTPVVVAMDTTGSMGTFPKVVYDKLPMFFGQLMMKGWAEQPAMAFSFFNHHTASRIPLQTTGFAEGAACDRNLKSLALVGGGGGDESYELAAFFYGYRARVKHRGYFFLIGDSLPTFGGCNDMPYSSNKTGDMIPAAAVERVLGCGVEADLPVGDVFKRLRERFDVFFICRVPTEHGVSDRDGKLQREYDDGADIPAPMLAKLEGWFGRNRVLRLRDPKAIVDVMLCAMAVSSGKTSWDGYVGDMRERGQTPERIEQVRWAFCPGGGSPTKSTPDEAAAV